MPGCMYVEEISSAAMLAAKMSAGVTPEVNFRERVTGTLLQSANKAAYSGFETQRCHQQSKTGVSVAPQRELMSSKNLRKKIDGKHRRSLELITFQFIRHENETSS